jgi:hypothetical protein
VVGGGLRVGGCGRAARRVRGRGGGGGDGLRAINQRFLSSPWRCRLSTSSCSCLTQTVLRGCPLPVHPPCWCYYCYYCYCYWVGGPPRTRGRGRRCCQQSARTMRRRRPRRPARRHQSPSPACWSDRLLDRRRGDSLPRLRLPPRLRFRPHPRQRERYGRGSYSGRAERARPRPCWCCRYRRAPTFRRRSSSCRTSTCRAPSGSPCRLSVLKEPKQEG